MDKLTPEMTRVLLKALVWLCAMLLGIIFTVGWWRITTLRTEFRELEHRIVVIETRLGITRKE